MQQHSPEPTTRLTNKDWIVRSDEPNPWFKKPGRRQEAPLCQYG